MIWHNMRLKADTYTLLSDYRARLEQAARVNPSIVAEELRGKRLSLSDALDTLIRSQKARTDRCRRYTARRSAKRCPGDKETLEACTDAAESGDSRPPDGVPPNGETLSFTP